MAKYLTDRQDRKLEEMARKLDGLSVRNNRLPSPSSLITGTDFGSPIVPRTTIPAATRIVQAGSDTFTPGLGTAYLFRVATGGEIEPRLDDSGAVIFKDVYNLSSKEYSPNDILLDLQDGIPLELQDDLLLELQNDLGPTDYIGPSTSVLFAMMDRSGKLFIPSDEEGEAGSEGTTQIAENTSGGPIGKLAIGTPGSAIVTIWRFTNGAIAATAVTVTAYNWSNAVIPEDEIFIIHKDLDSGRWLIAFDGDLSIQDDQSGGGNLEIAFPYETIKFQTTNPSGNVTVTKATDVVTVTHDLAGAGLPIGAFVPSYLNPILDAGKYYMDRDGAADTNWALADGASNATPGSGIIFWDRVSGGDTFFVRAHDVLEKTDNTAFGRTVAATPDDDEVRIQVAVDDHVDHIHQFNTDACHGDVVVPDTNFDFSTSATQDTSIQKTTGGGSLTLSHTVTVTLTNHQGGTSPTAEHIEMTPPNKHLHWFERVA